MKKLIFLGLLFSLTLNTNLVIGQIENAPEVNVVYGEKHIFTIETPDNWINDKDFAQKIGLVCFFYPKNEKDKSGKNYFYANGIDKENAEENLADFIEADLEQFRNKYPDMTFETTAVEFSGELRNGVLYSFSNLKDRYKEEVLYVETDDSFLIFSFAALTSEDYDKYQIVFDDFVASFNFRGNNPKPFLDHFKSH